MKNLVIIGSGGFARELIAYLSEEIKTNVLGSVILKGVVDDNHENYKTSGITIPYLGSTENYSPIANDFFVLAIANHPARLNIVKKIIARGGVFYTYIHHTAIIWDKKSIGDGSIICPYATVNVNAYIGSFGILNIYSNVSHDTKLGEHGILSPYCILNGNASAGNNLFMATRSTILPKVKIGDNCVISAHSCVNHDLPDNVIFRNIGQEQIVKNRSIKI